MYRLPYSRVRHALASAIALAAAAPLSAQAPCPVGEITNALYESTDWAGNFGFDVDGDTLAVHNQFFVFIYDISTGQPVREAIVALQEPTSRDNFVSEEVGGQPGVKIDGDTIIARGGWVIDRKSGSWAVTDKLAPPPGVQSLGKGDISGDTIAILAPPTTQPVGAGAVALYDLIDGEWTYQTTLLLPNRVAYDGFGPLEIDGDVLAIGAPGRDTAPGENDNWGCVFIYERSNGVWTQSASFLGSDLIPEACTFRLGFSISVSGLAVASNGYYDSRGCQGTPVLIEKVNGVWTHTETFTDSTNIRSLDLDGDQLVTGLFWSELVSPDIHAGRGNVYRRTDGQWQLEGWYVAPDRGYHDHFGLTIAAEGDNYVGWSPGKGALYIIHRPSPADLDFSGGVDGVDLAKFLANWGATSGVSDINGDNLVDGADLAALLAAWGGCP